MTASYSFIGIYDWELKCAATQKLESPRLPFSAEIDEENRLTKEILGHQSIKAVGSLSFGAASNGRNLFFADVFRQFSSFSPTTAASCHEILAQNQRERTVYFIAKYLLSTPYRNKNIHSHSVVFLAHSSHRASIGKAIHLIGLSTIDRSSFGCERHSWYRRPLLFIFPLVADHSLSLFKRNERTYAMQGAKAYRNTVCLTCLSLSLSPFCVRVSCLLCLFRSPVCWFFVRDVSPIRCFDRSVRILLLISLEIFGRMIQREKAKRSSLDVMKCSVKWCER